MAQSVATQHGGELNPLDTTGLCLLSLDGGGVRGLSTLYILKGLMTRLNHERQKAGLPRVKPCEVFDLIGGTSTGGLIAIMLGRLEMDVDECIIAYSEIMKAVFEKKPSWLPISWSGKVKARFDSAKLKSAIEDAISKTDASSADAFNDGKKRGCHTFVCATAKETAGVTRLRSYTLPDEGEVPATICQVALATLAATGFFDPVSIGARQFVDGALGANNPVDEVEGEAANIWSPGVGDLKPPVKCFISIGTGHPGKKALEDNIAKFLSKSLVGIATETEKTEKNFIARWAKHYDKKRYFRFNVDQGLYEVRLAEYKEQSRIEATTDEYLRHPVQKSRVRDCIENLQQKQSVYLEDFDGSIFVHSPGKGKSQVEPLEPMSAPLFPVTINGNPLDQTIPPAPNESKPKYILVQSQARLSPSQRQELNAKGLKLHEYVFKNTYLYSNPGVDLGAIRQMGLDVRVDVYRQEFKITPGLKRAAPSSPYSVDVIFHEGADSKSKFKDLEQKSFVQDVQISKHKARLTVQGRHLENLASIDEVRRIEEVGKLELRLHNALQVVRPPVEENPAEAQNHPYEGEGQVIAIADNGFDRGFVDPVHKAFDGRVHQINSFWRAKSDCHGHGTHVCGAAVGSGMMNNMPVRGTAPRAGLVVQCLGCDLQGTPSDSTTLFEAAYDFELDERKVRVHSNSWGHAMGLVQNGYDASAEEIDRFVWEHLDMVICFAAGNDGKKTKDSAAQIGSEAAAKNCITVGACENDYPDRDQDPNRVANFSSRGPTLSGEDNDNPPPRFKPDVVAPGTWILSTCSGQLDTQWIALDEELSDRIGLPWGQIPDNNWWYMEGTSMATPLVAGCAAVLREALLTPQDNAELNPPDRDAIPVTSGAAFPSAALIKALIINGAEILARPTPNADSGFGRVNLTNSILTARRRGGARFHEEFLKDGELERKFEVEIPHEHTLRTTLVWSDYQGERVQNELCLRIEGVADPDFNNNVQQIECKGPRNAIITVKAQQLLHMPQNLPFQPFAIVWRLYRDRPSQAS